MKKTFKGICNLIAICLFCAILLCPKVTMAGSIEDALIANMKSVYAKALSLAGRTEFGGMCGLCTGRQLQAAGVFNSYVGSDGNKAYKKYVASQPSSGVSVTAFPGKYESGSYTIEQICNLINDLNTIGENTYIAFCFETGSSSSAGQTYGHVLLVHAIYDGKVYWGESFGKQTRVASISDFASTYAHNGKTYHFDGAVAFGYKELQEKAFQRIDDTPRIAVSTKLSSSSDPCRLQSAPYDQRQYDIKLIEKGEIVYIKGAVENSYGNTWYCIVDVNDKPLGYIYKSDLEIKEDNAVFTLKESLNLMGVVKTNDGYQKDKPYEAADHHNRTIAKGKSVQIVASYTNSHNHVWYKTDEGYFIYSGDVDTYKCTPLFDISAKFRNTEKRYSHAAPYLDSAEKKQYYANDEVTVVSFVTNSHGNIWAKLTDGTYLCFKDFETGENKLKFASDPLDIVKISGLPASDVTGYPTGNRKAGDNCGLRGTITSTAPMQYVTVRIMNRTTGAVVSAPAPVTAKPGITVRTGKLNDSKLGKNINSAMSFGQLTTTGYYQYQIIVRLGFIHNGETFNFGNEVILFDSNFTIGNPTGNEELLPDNPVVTPTPKPTPTPTPKPTPTNANEGNGKYQTAPDRISYYHQYMKTDGKTTWDYHTNNTYWDEKLDSVYGLAISDGDGDTPNISGRGCGLLAYGHAIQWLDGKADSARQIEILAELVRKSKNPPTAEEIYGEYVASEYDAVFAKVGSDWTESALQSIFDQDGVIIVCNKYSSGNNSGHIALAIGYRVYNGTFYVQMMDSTCRATLKRLPDGGASARVYDFSSAANMTFSAGQYWVPLEQFSGIIKWSYSLIPKKSSGGNSSTPTPTPSPTPTPKPTSTPTPKPTNTPTPTSSRLPGDANNDGIVNVADAMIIRQYIAGYSVSITLLNADVNADDTVNVADAMMIRQFLAGYSVLLQ